MTSIFSFPFETIGNLLRALSLSGSIGNVIAIGIYILFCSCPSIYYLFLRIKKKNTLKDELLWFISICLFGGIYLYINPGLINELTQLSQLTEECMFSIGATIWAVIILYILLCVLHGIEKKESVDLLATMRYIVIALGILVILDIGMNVLSLVTELQTISRNDFQELFYEDFFEYDFHLNGNYIWVVMKYILYSIPSVLLLRILFISRNIIKTLQKDSFNEEAIERLHKLAVSCKNVVIAIGILTVLQNFIQLVFAKYIISANYLVVIPIDTLLLVFIIMLLAKKFSENRELKLDNDSFI